MATIKEMIQQAKDDGYMDENAEAKVCQDIVLMALSKSQLSRHATIKGGVVMRSISHDARRATQDMDIDFIRYSLSDETIGEFIRKLNCLEDIYIRQTGVITELKQQDYHGKRVFVVISDEMGDSVESKIDLGVHKNFSIEQEEYCFDIACFDDRVSLLVNSKEQMFTGKLRSLLKFGPASTRYKDIFDMCYLLELMDRDKLITCLNTFIINDPGMRENNMQAISRRIKNTFASDRYVSRLSGSRTNWLDVEISDAFNKILSFLEKL